LWLPSSKQTVVEALLDALDERASVVPRQRAWGR
jgi:hypothetical protein